MKRAFSLLCLLVLVLLSSCQSNRTETFEKEIQSVKILGETHASVYVYRVTDLQVLGKTADLAINSGFVGGVNESVYDLSPLDSDYYIVSDRLLKKSISVSDKSFPLRRKLDGAEDNFCVSATVTELSQELRVEKKDCGETYCIIYYSCEPFATTCSFFPSAFDAQQSLQKTILETVKQNVLIYYEP